MVFGFNVDLVILVLITFSLSHKMIESLFLALLTWLFYPLLIFGVGQALIFANPISWVLEYMIPFLLTVPFGIIKMLRTDNYRIYFGVIGVIIFYLIKLLLHTISGTFLWGQDSLMASFLINIGYITFNAILISLTIPIIIMSLDKINNKNLDTIHF